MGVRPSKRVQGRFSLHGTRPFHRTFWHLPVPHAVFDAKCSYAERAVALVLHRETLIFEDGQWTAEPRPLRVRSLQRKTGLSRQTVHTALTGLEARGWADVDRGGRSHQVTWRLSPPTSRFVQVPVLLIDQLPNLPSRTAGLVFWLVVRHTLGWTVTKADEAASGGVPPAQPISSQDGDRSHGRTDARGHYWEWARMSIAYIADELGRSPAAVRTAIQELQGRLIERRRVGPATEGAEFRVLPEAFSRLAHQRGTGRMLARGAERGARAPLQPWTPQPLARREPVPLPSTEDQGTENRGAENRVAGDGETPEKNGVTDGAEPPRQAAASALGREAETTRSVQNQGGDRPKTERGAPSSYKRDSQKTLLGAETKPTASAPSSEDASPGKKAEGESGHLQREHNPPASPPPRHPRRRLVVVQGIEHVQSTGRTDSRSANSRPPTQPASTQPINTDPPGPRGPSSSTPRSASALDALPEQKRAACKALIDHGVFQSLALQYVRRYSLQRLRRNAGYAVHQHRAGAVAHLGAYMAGAIVDDYADGQAPAEAGLPALTHLDTIPEAKKREYVRKGIYAAGCFTGAGTDTNKRPLVRYIDPEIGVNASKAAPILDTCRNETEREGPPRASA